MNMLDMSDVLDVLDVGDRSPISYVLMFLTVYLPIYIIKFSVANRQI